MQHLDDDTFLHVLEHLPLVCIFEIQYLNKDFRQRVINSFSRLSHKVSIDKIPLQIVNEYKFSSVALKAPSANCHEKILAIAPYVKILDIRAQETEHYLCAVDQFPALRSFSISFKVEQPDWKRHLTHNLTTLHVGVAVSLDEIKLIVKYRNLMHLEVKSTAPIDLVMQEISQLADTLQLFQITSTSDMQNSESRFSPPLRKLTKLLIQMNDVCLRWLLQHDFESVKELQIGTTDNSFADEVSEISNPRITLPNLERFEGYCVSLESCKFIASIVGTKIRWMNTRQCELFVNQHNIQYLNMHNLPYKGPSNFICNNKNLVALKVARATAAIAELHQLKHLKYLRILMFSHSIVDLINMLPNLETVIIGTMVHSDSEPIQVAKWTKLIIKGTQPRLPLELYSKYLPNLKSVRLHCRTRESVIQLTHMLRLTQIEDVHLVISLQNRDHPLECCPFPQNINYKIEFDDTTTLDEYVLYCLCMFRSMVEFDCGDAIVFSTFTDYTTLCSEVVRRGGQKRNATLAIQIAYENVIDNHMLGMSMEEKQDLKDLVRRCLQKTAFNYAVSSLQSLLQQCLATDTS